MPSLQVGPLGPSTVPLLAAASQTVPVPSALQTFTPGVAQAATPTEQASPRSVKVSSTAPSPSLSLPSQTSAVWQLVSARSVVPSQSLSLPSEQRPLLAGPSMPGMPATAVHS